MGAYMTTDYNSNCVCVMCDKTKEEGTVKNGKFVCNQCIDGLVPTQKKTSPSVAIVDNCNKPPLPANVLLGSSNSGTVYPLAVDSKRGVIYF